MAELADAQDLGSCLSGGGGSTPPSRIHPDQKGLGQSQGFNGNEAFRFGDTIGKVLDPVSHFVIHCCD